jgi:hypothetical protein
MTDDILIKAILKTSKARYGSGLSDGDAFELFTAESILKRFGLTFDEIEGGVVDGKDDGGVDSVYIFVNNAIIASDSDLDSFKSPVEIDLYIIQSKMDTGFSETAMAHLSATIPEVIALGADDAKLAKRYNSEVRGWFQIYRETIKSLAAQFPTINVHIVYCTLATAPNTKVEAMIPGLEKAVAAHHPKAHCTIELWDAAKLYAEANKQNVLTKHLPFVKQPISHGKGYVILATLKDYFDFITDNGKIVDSLFEFNVRDYQSSAAVNKEIAETLNTVGDTADFWWLNNGVTMLAEQASSQDVSLTIRNPIVVNGLQTSHEIHRFFSSGKTDPENRCVQVRVLEIEDDARRDRVIKATNSQTGIRPASLHATEPFQRKIEDYLQQQNIFYDRRKDYWRNKGKPADQIIGIDKLAQAVIAVLLQRPHDARARPTSIMRDEILYQKLFSDDNHLAIYKVCAELHFAVDVYLKSVRKTVDSIYRNNLRYHLMMQLSWRVNGSRPVHESRLKSLKISALKEADIKLEFDHAMKLFDKAGAEDKTAKDIDFTKILKSKSIVKQSSLASGSKAKPKKAIMKKKK